MHATLVTSPPTPAPELARLLHNGLPRRRTPIKTLVGRVLSLGTTAKLMLVTGVAVASGAAAASAVTLEHHHQSAARVAHHARAPKPQNDADQQAPASKRSDQPRPAASVISSPPTPEGAATPSAGPGHADQQSNSNQGQEGGTKGQGSQGQDSQNSGAQNEPSSGDSQSSTGQSGSSNQGSGNQGSSSGDGGQSTNPNAN
jgi:hypothetical protein